MTDFEEVLKRARGKRSQVEQLVFDIEAHLSVDAEGNLPEHDKYVKGAKRFLDRANKIGLTSPQGVRRSGFSRMWGVWQGRQLFDHMLSEGRRVLNVLDNENGYKPRAKPLYTSSDKKTHPLYRSSPEDFDPLLP